jgi:aconitate hydratase
MGIVPCQFNAQDSIQTLGLDGSETFDLIGIANGDVKPRQEVELVIHRKNGQQQTVSVTIRVDSPIEVEYLKHGGILPFVLREILATGA